jgi:hypothetical protein
LCCVWETQCGWAWFGILEWAGSIYLKGF